METLRDYLATRKEYDAIEILKTVVLLMKGDLEIEVKLIEDVTVDRFKYYAVAKVKRNGNFIKEITGNTASTLIEAFQNLEDKLALLIRN